MFDIYRTVVTLKIYSPGYVSDDKVNYDKTYTTQPVTCYFNNSPKYRLMIDSNNNALTGQLQSGQAIMVVKASALNWHTYVNTKTEIIYENVRYRIVEVETKPRAWTIIRLEKLK